MTLLMNMVIADDNRVNRELKRNTLLLVEMLVRNEEFDDAFINHKAVPSLALMFERQHYQGYHKDGKMKNSVIVAGQKISLKRIKKKNKDGVYTDFKGPKMKDDQVKMISKHKVKLRQGDGTEEVEKRIMITCKIDKGSSAANKDKFRVDRSEEHTS